MGMDIHGLNPVMRSEKPTIDWNIADEQERVAYITAKDKFEQENPGVYFRANVWSWRPIAEIILDCNHVYKLGYSEEFINGVHLNNGVGLLTQEECNVLANHLEMFIDEYFKDWNVVGLNTGWYFSKVVDDGGKVTMVSLKDDDEAKVSTFLGTKKYVKEGEIDMDKFVYFTSHNTNVEWVREFIKFLRECGGFEIL
jgi:hypothetical protein